MPDQLEEMTKAMQQLQAGEVRVLEQARSACDSVANQMEELTVNIAAARKQLISSVSTWEEENLAKIRCQQMKLIKSLDASTKFEAQKWSTVENLSVKFSPTPLGNLLNLVGTLSFHQIEDRTLEPMTHGTHETIVRQLKEHNEKESDTKIKQDARVKSLKEEEGARGDLSQVTDSGEGRAKEDKAYGENLVEQTKKPKEEQRSGAKSKTGERLKGPRISRMDNETQESVQVEECSPEAASRPTWASVGSQCVARWDEDGVWYSAQVLQHMPPNLCMVLFVNHGNCAEVEPDDMVKEMAELQTGEPIDPLLQKKSIVVEHSLGDTLIQDLKVKNQPQVDSSGDGIVDTWELGSVCIARWIDDGVWYRAKVIEALEGNCYTVCFIDYGNAAMTTCVDMVLSRKNVPEGEVIDEHVLMDREVGSDCWAFYKEDKVWCRAKLLEKTKNGWLVEFVDYDGERAEVSEENVVDSLENVPRGDKIDAFVGREGHDVAVEGVEANLKDPVEMNQLLEEYNTMASSKHSTSRGHREFDVDEEDSQEPSMEMEQDESKPVVPMPVSPEVSTAPTCLSSNPALQLQPGDTCLAVWAEDGVLYNAQLLDWHPNHAGADLLFVDYDNVERVELKDMYINLSDVPASMVAQNLVDIYVETGIVMEQTPSFEQTSPALRLKLVWSVETSWSPQYSTRLAILPNGKVVVALPHMHTVLLFNKEGKAKGNLGTFGYPHDVTALEGGNVAVLDDKKIIIFSKSGEKQELVPQGLNIAAGLCADQEGALVTINRCDQEKEAGTVTKPGQTDLLFIQGKSGKIEKRLEMEEIIEKDSSCTLLASCAARLHVGDQGLSQVYTLFVEEGELQATVCGGPELWGEVSSIAGMSDGGLLVLDAVTQRLLRLSASGELMGHAEVEGELQEAVAVATWEKSLIVASDKTLALYRMEELQ